MAILAAAGDIGGVRALAPALRELASAGGKLLAWKHRDLPAALQGLPTWQGGALPPGRCFVFATSVADTEPLALARRCRAAGWRVECLLDNWVNYRRRLELDGQPMLVPDAYHVMDELAREQAIADGIPAAAVAVSGHPDLGTLAAPSPSERAEIASRLRAALSIPPDHRLLVFVSEPAQADQNPGYSEADVLKAMCSEVGQGRWGVCVLAHPREDLETVRKSWRAASAGIPGGVLPRDGLRPRDAVAAADAVAGMTSILLYESWVLGLPTLSLQPGLERADLRVFRARRGVLCAETPEEMRAIAGWLEAAGTARPRARPELELHRGAAGRLARAWMPYAL